MSKHDLLWKETEMKIRVKSFDVISYIFFFLYFVSYIGEKTIIKYAAIILFQVYLLLHIKKSDIFHHDKRYTLLFIGIFLTLLISVGMNFSVSAAVKTLSLIDLFILAYFMLSKGIERFHIEERYFITIISNTLFVALCIAFVFGFNDTMLGLGRQSSTIVRHLFGFGVPSIVGFLCFVEFTLSFYLLTERRKKRTSNVFLYLKIILSIYMIILADIRASMVAIAIFLLMYVLFMMPQKRGMIVIEVIVLLGVFVGCVISLSNTSMSMASLNALFSQRFLYFSRAISEVIGENAILFGLGSFRNSEVSGLSKIQVDNCFLDIFYQYGIFVFIFFVGLIVRICLDLYKISKNKPKNDVHQNRYMQFINSYFISVLAYSMVEKNLFSISSALSLVTFLLIFWYVTKNKSNNYYI